MTATRYFDSIVQTPACKSVGFPLRRCPSSIYHQCTPLPIRVLYAAGTDLLGNVIVYPFSGRKNPALWPEHDRRLVHWSVKIRQINAKCRGITPGNFLPIHVCACLQDYSQELKYLHSSYLPGLTYGVPQVPRHKNIAAYAYASLEKETMLHSLSTQVNCYREMIQKHPGWRYAGVYADVG